MHNEVQCTTIGSSARHHTQSIHRVWCLMLETTAAEQTIYFEMGRNSSPTCAPVRPNDTFLFLFFFCFFFIFSKRKNLYFSLLFDSKCAANTAVASYFFVYVIQWWFVICPTFLPPPTLLQPPSRHPSRTSQQCCHCRMGTRLASKPIQITWLVYNFNWRKIHESLVCVCAFFWRECVEWTLSLWTHPLYHANALVEQQIA